VVFAGGCGRAGPQADLHQIPGQNVLLITVDTLRADALGSYGGPAATPALDRLAADGVRFDFAHAHAVTTLTSHASILTGTYPFQHGIRDNSGYRLAAETRTVATWLKRVGYATAAFVGAFPVHSRFGLNQGFDVYDDQFGDTRAPDEFAMPERPASTVVPLARQWIADQGAGRAGQAGGAGRAGRAGRAGQAGQAGGAGRAGGPGTEAKSWFVWVHVFDPHAPYRPPPPFDTRYASQPYYGEVAAVDAALAPLLDDLRTASKPTLVIVTGDHGEALGDHGEQSHGLFAYESTLRVPLIIAPLGGTQSAQRSQSESFFAGFAAFAFRNASAGGGEVSSVSARHVDILPTILDAVGLAVPADLVGRTLLTAADGAERLSPRPSYFEAMSATLNRGWAPLTGVIVGREKYIDLPIAERYDLAADSAEQANLVGRSPERDRTLAAALRGFNSTTPGPRQMEDAEAATRLRALGYLSGSAPLKARYAEADDPKQLVDLDRGIHDAVEAFTAGRAAAAVQIYQRVIARRPDMALAYRHLAFILWQRGDAAGAIDALRRAMKGGVADPRLMGQLGGYLAETGHIAEGIRLLEPAAAAANTDLDSLNALGIAYAQTGRADAARAIFQRVLTINPRSGVPLENLGLLALERGDVIEARRQFELAVQVDPRSSRAQAGLGNVALKVGDRTAAIDAWTRAVQIDPRNFDALYNVGTALARGGQMDAARPYLDRFLETAPPAFYAKELKEVAALLHR
jgi:arylsulfatase A-like enzyme/Tfp pilus assembly protein PilF